MSKYVKLLHTDTVNTEQIVEETNLLLNNYLDSTCTSQLSLSTNDASIDNWEGYIPRITFCDDVEKEGYNKICPSVIKHAPHITEFIQRFPKYYGWRILVLDPKTLYSLHCDGTLSKNVRIHLPVVSNPQSLLLFFDRRLEFFASKIGLGTEFLPDDGKATYHKLYVGNSYMVNTNGVHTAINGNISETRIHIVGEKTLYTTEKQIALREKRND